MRKLYHIVLLLACTSLSAFGQSDKLQLSIGYSHAVNSNFTGNNYKENSNVFNNSSSDTIGNKKSAQLNGFDISGAYRLSDHLAAKASFSWYTGSTVNTVPGGAFGRGSATEPTYVLIVPGFYDHGKQTYLSALVGMEYKDFKSAHKLNPFGHLMIGLGFENNSHNLIGLTHAIIYDTQNLKVKTSALTVDAGAGLDLKLNKNFDLRIIQVDFVPAFRGKTDIQKQGKLSGPFPGTSFPNDQLYQLHTVTTNSSFQANFRFGIGVVFTPNL